MNKLKIGIVSLGCDKNRIDTEIALGSLQLQYEITNDPKNADIIIVNTCGFIEASKQESIDSILEMIEYKKKYKCKILVATGCLTQRYGEELLRLIPEIDIILGVNSYEKLLLAIDSFLSTNNKFIDLSYSDSTINQGKRIISTGSFSAYLRIGEGCDNNCTYCIIPKIRGKYRSRRLEDIIEEAKELASNGVNEIILVAQDTTRYGTDLYKAKMLPKLLKELSKIEGIKWIRLLYTYVEEIDEELIDEMASNEKVLKYIDLPIQHISNSILKRMLRRGTKEQIVKTINKIRIKMPDITLRTSLIVGFPGETREDFDELLDFVRDTRFDKLGSFTYSMEEDTAAALMKEQIPEAIKEERKKELMILQKSISNEINLKKIGKQYEVLIEGKNGEEYYGRSYEMAPEIDGLIYFKSDNLLSVGDFINVTIVKANEYDLLGVV